ncbi:hypothetical protein V4171_003163, partial [Klebsiella pneumoniae]
IHDDISVGELPEWFDSQMVSNDGKSGFLTRAEAEEAIKKACPATDRIVAGIKADGVALVKSAFEMHIQSASCYQDEIVGMESAMSIACQVESQLREGADK